MELAGPDQHPKSNGSQEEAWKEQLAFVSSYILLFGFALLKLWPFTAAYQTGRHVHLWTANWASQGVSIPLWGFWCLTAIVGIALSAVTLAIVHIACRGLWLAFFSGDAGDTPAGRMATLLDKLRAISYDSAFMLFFFIVMVLYFVFTVMLRAGLEQWLESRFGLSTRAAGWIGVAALILILIPFFAAGIPRAIRYMSGLSLEALGSALRIGFATFGLFWVMWLFTIEFCHTTEVSVAGSIFERSRNDRVEVSLNLGGATSDLSVARIQLLDSHNKPVSNLEMQDLGDGHYLSIVQARDLSAGRYAVALGYPHATFDGLFPFVHTQVNQERRFLVIP